ADGAQLRPRRALPRHAPWQLVPRPYPRGIRRRADRARRAMEHRAVARFATLPVMALHAALEALALRHAHDVDHLARREDLDGEILADRVVAELLGGRLVESQLAHDTDRAHAELLEVALHRLRHVLRLRLQAAL